MKIILTILFLTISTYATSQNASKDDIKMLVYHMDKRFEQVDKRFEQVDKRFEQVDKRFELMQQQMDKRFEQVDKRFDTQLYLIIAGFTLIMGYLLKERSFIAKMVKDELKPELVKKADKNILDQVVAIIGEMAKQDKEVEAILTKHHLKLA
jgi:tetrahydromethanopterin S-methyltransferase subunit G